MNQADQFLHFVAKQQDMEICKVETLVRIENEDIVITKRYPIGRAIEFQTDFPRS